MEIYILENPATSCCKELHLIDSLAIPAHEKIGAIWSRMRDCFLLNQGKLSFLKDYFSLLGVEWKDRVAVKDLFEIVKTIFTKKIEIFTSTHPGAYFVKELGKDIPFAVFKIGRKRTQIEQLVRHVAFKVGLHDQVVSGLFCSLQNPIIIEDEDHPCHEELWSLWEKEYQTDDEDFHVVGILEPYIQVIGRPLSIEKELFYHAQTIVFLVITGGRGCNEVLRGNLRNRYVYSILINDQYSFPPRLLPQEGVSPEETIASTNLPLLNSPLSTRLLPKKVRQKIKKIVNKISNVFEFCKELSQYSVKYEDRRSEIATLALKKRSIQDVRKILSSDIEGDFQKGFEGLDDGEAIVRVKPKTKSIFLEDDSILDIREKVLTSRQLSTMQDRILLMKEFLEERKRHAFSIQDLVFFVDRFFAAHCHDIRISKKSSPY